MSRTKKLPPGLWRRGDVYYARFTHGGREIRKRLSSDLAVARQGLNDLRARADRGDLGIIDNDYKWDELKAEFLRWARQSVRASADYERDLARFEAYCRVQSIRQIDEGYVIGYRAWRLSQPVGTVAGKEWKKAAGRTVSPRTINREVGTLHNMLNRAVRLKLIGCNPVANLTPLAQGDARKQRRSLTSEEVQAIFREAPAYLRPVLRLYATTGMRREELVSLRFSDVDLEHRCITIRASVAKSKKVREIPLDDDTVAMLAELREQAKAREPVRGATPEQTAQQAARFSRDHVFVSKANTPLKNNLLTRFYAVCRKAGIEGAEQGGSIDLHSLRVTFTTLALENGASPKAVQSILGHSTLAMTMGVYAKATERSKREAIGALPFAKVSAPDHIISLDERRTESATGSSSDAQSMSGQRVAIAT